MFFFTEKREKWSIFHVFYVFLDFLIIKTVLNKQKHVDELAKLSVKEK